MRNIRTAVAGIMMAMVVFAGTAFAAGEAPKDDAALMMFAEAFGAVEGMALYNGQLLIGVTADAYANDVYTADDALQIIGIQKSGLDLEKDYLNKMLQLPEVASDPGIFKQMIGSIDALKATALAFEVFIGDPSQENADDFEAKRQVSYSSIAKLMGLEE